MRITTKGRYAIRAIINMALNAGNKPISIKSISNSEELSPIFLEQIFTKLKKAGIAESVRGASGGFRIARELNEITVLDVLEAVEEGVELAPCTTPEGTCGRSADCAISAFWSDTEEMIRDQLRNQTIQTILDKYMDVE
ncbi:Rrf2 family transcriptional regulator [Oceanispirochaeta crateris]|jgi:Rrf2 family iron-sulfur cluster assembly transcriptional regulator|uniref:Rrf2 family transcriptional regulator n=1 Tax=Oceanispirochaeta crateris TaxID=2518645 RepID=A0A5C1QN48_9SPIO|nr:Rrf2 family transcriptional regulator [Oceanispirochaeta crateris]QEN09373.1 Rrf2 family transcriptional regulator [Oceanispirochaeta crateris]